MQQAQPAPRKSYKGILAGVGCGCLSLLSLCCGTGGWLAYADNRELANPDGARVVEVPLAGSNYSVPVGFDGHGYEFQQVWLDVHGVAADGRFRLQGTLSCGTDGYDRPYDLEVGPTTRGYAAGPTPGSFEAVVQLGDDYLRSGEHHTCTGTVDAGPGTITSATVYVTERQRPSDFFAN